ncbi:hypothetical protein [Serinicoccus marinus]|uniref:hypothetical protein n=1 Tax=Serinicoccus marinus TaxID=247333 RepID=UPI0013759355|nr:hypothetical protein [Serinicoccus marinus]
MLVPVAAGGDRDEHTKIDVVEVLTAENGESMVALRLARASPGGRSLGWSVSPR